YVPNLPIEEAGPTSSVWRVYLDESRDCHVNMVAEQRAKLNVILVFAGLFSSVVTAFVIQSSANSKPDYQKLAALLLFDQINIQRALANGTSIDNIITSNTDPTAHFTPDRNDVVSHVLLLTSLVLSLITAFLAILLDTGYSHYLWTITEQLKSRAHTQHVGYTDQINWPVHIYIIFLQLLLHLSVITFFYGLIF
ncbi:hypothetical protein IW261DRAFT_1306290, partial [Armillaria novae-zelandiae]